MPNYTFENTDTGEQYILSLTMKEREEYLEKNPNVRQILSQIFVGDPIIQGVTKPPSDFSKYVLGRIKEQVPKSEAIERRHTIVREF